jgi:hypothetical protein
MNGTMLHNRRESIIIINTWMKPFAINLALNLAGSLGYKPSFLFNIHLQWTTFLCLGNHTTFNVPFFSRDCISYFIEKIHFSRSTDATTSVYVAGSEYFPHVQHNSWHNKQSYILQLNASKE